MKLDMFQAKYTSEDNESFNALLDEQNAKQREKNAWMYNGNKMLSKQEFVIEQKRVLLLEQGMERRIVGERDPEDTEGWSKQVQTWNWTPMNVLMNPHPGLEEQTDPAHGQKLIRHDNTRIPQVKTTTTHAPSPSMSTVEDAIQGHPRTETPKVNGYSFVSTPTATELGAPKMTWGSISSTPIPLYPSPSPFRLAEITDRDKLAHKLAEKAQKEITARQRAYTPRLRTLTTLGTPSIAHNTSGKDIPKFATSPDIRRGLTPAGKRLLASSAQGRRGTSRLVAQTTQRETGSLSGIGRTPLMKTPALGTPINKGTSVEK
jgi:protein DGCR14